MLMRQVYDEAEAEAKNIFWGRGQ